MRTMSGTIAARRVRRRRCDRARRPSTTPSRRDRPRQCPRWPCCAQPRGGGGRVMFGLRTRKAQSPVNGAPVLDLSGPRLRRAFDRPAGRCRGDRRDRALCRRAGAEGVAVRGSAGPRQDRGDDAKPSFSTWPRSSRRCAAGSAHGWPRTAFARCRSRLAAADGRLERHRLRRCAACRLRGLVSAGQARTAGCAIWRRRSCISPRPSTTR